MNFLKVSQEQFYAVIGPMDVHPRPERHVTYWETPNRTLVGRSTPGYLCVGPKEYFLVEGLAA